MLVYAKTYEEELKKNYQKIAFDDFYKYDHYSACREPLAIPDDTWSAHDFVSIHNEQIIGHIGYSIRRVDNIVNSLIIRHFGGKNAGNDYIFGKDTMTCIKDIFEKFKFNKLNFTVIVGNPVESTYDRLVKRYGGRIVGVLKQDIKLIDGEIYDQKVYEILAEDYFSKKAHSPVSI
jgi:hypothetical protein